MLNSTLSLILDVLFPVSCLICNKETSCLCSSCEQRLYGSFTTEYNPSKYIDQIISASSYKDHSIQKIIKAYKFSGIVSLAEPLGRLMTDALDTNFSQGSATFVPIPLHQKKLIRRGYNQSYLLAKKVANTSQFPINSKLIRIKHTPQQSRLSHEERLVNLNNAFVYTNPPAPAQVILIDDVATTLTTLNSAASVLKKYGTKTVIALVAARET